MKIHGNSISIFWDRKSLYRMGLSYIISFNFKLLLMHMVAYITRIILRTQRTLFLTLKLKKQKWTIFLNFYNEPTEGVYDYAS